VNPSVRTVVISEASRIAGTGPAHRPYRDVTAATALVTVGACCCYVAIGVVWSGNPQIAKAIVDEIRAVGAEEGKR
jgi:hypothetical protein